MSQATEATKNSRSYYIMVSIFLIGIAIILISFFVQQHQIKQAKIAEMEQINLFIKAKNHLEACSNKTPDKEIRFASFDMLLQHTIKHDVPLSSMLNMLKKCEATLERA